MGFQMERSSVIFSASLNTYWEIGDVLSLAYIGRSDQTMDTSSDIRQSWLDVERSVRRRMAEVGVISPDQLESFGARVLGTGLAGDRAGAANYADTGR
jgi:hypothetical protein